MKKIICATGMATLNETVAGMQGYEVVAAPTTMEETKQAIPLTQADILILTELVEGEEDFAEFIVWITQNYSQLRIVLLTGGLNLEDPDRKRFFEVIYTAGVYDIIYGESIKKDVLENLLNNPNTKDSLSFLGRKKGQRAKSSFSFDAQNEELANIQKYYNNVFSFSSIKPGTGKSFCSINVATLIAEYGARSPETGKAPKVALIEADLQNLSIGTLLGITGDKKTNNLKTALEKISTIMEDPTEDHPSLIEDTSIIEDTNKFIVEECFRRFSKAPNLYTLVGSELTYEQLADIKEYQYSYLIDLASKNFDVVIIDTNSSFEQRNTFSMLAQSKICFYILNLDFNNVRNNIRYLPFLERWGIKERIQYILNQYIPEDPPIDYFGLSIEKLDFDAGFIESRLGKQFLAKIPALPLTVFLNCAFNNTPVALTNKDETFEVRYQLTKIANTIWPIEKMAAIEAKRQGLSEINKIEEPKRKGLFRK